MKKSVKRQVLAALAAAAFFCSANALPVYALDTDHILVKGEDVSADLLSPENGGYLYGVVGGDIYLDSGTTNDEGKTVSDGVIGTFGKIDDKLTLLQNLALLVNGVQLPDFVSDIASFVEKVDSTLSEKNVVGADVETLLEGDAGLTLENYGMDWVRYYGAIGGDLSVNTGLDDGSLLFDVGFSTSSADWRKGYYGNGADDALTKSEATKIIRTGNINNSIESGTVIGGVGASAAAALGKLNMKISYEYDTSYSGLLVPVLTQT